MNTRFFRLSAAVLAAMMTFGLTSCSDDDPEDPSTPSTVNPGEGDQPGGLLAQELDFIVLNQGNFGQENSSVIFYGHIGHSDLIEPFETLTFGGVGNDMIEDDDYLYIAYNGSDKVVVMKETYDDDYDFVGDVSVLQPRYLAVDGKYLYVTSYIASDMSHNGSIVKIDRTTLDVVGQLDLVCQPEQIAIVGGKAYVANSGYFDNETGTSTFSNILSVIDLKTFTVSGQIEMPAVNLHHVAADSRGRLWVSSRGNYVDQPSCLMRVTLGDAPVIDTVNILTDNFTIYGNKAYTYAINYAAGTNNYVAVDLNTLATEDYLKPDVAAKIVTPYGIAIEDEDDVDYIYILDANNYGTTGYVYSIKAGANAIAATYEAGPLPCCILFD